MLNVGFMSSKLPIICWRARGYYSVLVLCHVLLDGALLTLLPKAKPSILMNTSSLLYSDLNHLLLLLLRLYFSKHLCSTSALSEYSGGGVSFLINNSAMWFSRKDVVVEALNWDLGDMGSVPNSTTVKMWWVEGQANKEEELFSYGKNILPRGLFVHFGG